MTHLFLGTPTSKFGLVYAGRALSAIFAVASFTLAAPARLCRRTASPIDVLGAVASPPVLVTLGRRAFLAAPFALGRGRLFFRLNNVTVLVSAVVGSPLELQLHHLLTTSNVTLSSWEALSSPSCSISAPSSPPS